MGIQTGSRTSDIGRIIGILASLRGLHMKNVAAVVGVDPATITRRLRGGGGWDAEDLEKLAAEFEVPITAFFTSPQDVWDFIADNDSWAPRGSNPRPMDQTSARQPSLFTSIRTERLAVPAPASTAA